MAGRDSWYDRYPDYRVDLEFADQRVQAVFNDTVIAVSDKPLIVRETDHAPVVYFSLNDVNLEHFSATEHHTFCPFKGQASYWTLAVGAAVAENVMWSYPEPFPQVAGLAGFAAFYTDRVAVSAVDENVSE